jgi:hypothetical protein
MAVESPDDLARRVQDACARLRPKVRDVDPGDLLLIVQSLLRPVGSGRKFLLRANAKE